MAVSNWLYIGFGLCFILTMITGQEQKEECAVDERVNVALDINSVELPSKILMTSEDKANEDACYKSCCDSIESGEPCNTASFFKDGDKYVCIIAQCTPFSSCVFMEYLFALAAKVAVFNTSVNFDEQEEAEQTGDGGLQGTAAPPTENTTRVSNDTLNQELEEEVEQLFESENASDAWNIQYEYDYSTTNYDYSSDAITSKENAIEDETTESPTEGNTFATGSDENWTGGGDGSTEHTGGDQGGEGATDGATDQVDVVKPHLTHGNSGIYGPHEVADFDYSSTPLIVIGVVVTVLFLLLLFVFVGRKMMRDDRLKYRPLRESFPAANAYHDLEK